MEPSVLMNPNSAMVRHYCPSTKG